MAGFSTSTLCNFILLFMVFSVAGWMMEVTLKYIEFHRFINRGFLIGLYCPIYGTGAVLVTFMVHMIAGEDAGYVEAFLISFVFCGALEYLVSWLLEKIYHARWWDYSYRPMNLDGRIWIGNLLLFGIGGDIIVKLIAPLLFRAFGHIPTPWLYGICCFCVIVLAADYTVSHFVTNMIKHVGEASREDNTEAISKEIRRILTSKSFLHKRIMDAYPNMQARTVKIQHLLREERRRVKNRFREERDRYYKRVK